MILRDKVVIRLKSAEEIERLAEGGKILAFILEQLAQEAKAGVTPQQLDQRSRQLIKEHKVKPAFLNYAPRGQAPFPAALCVSVNHAVVHGLPGDTPFKEGDVAGLDLGIVYQGLYLDSARTVGIGTLSAEALRLLRVTREALELGIVAAQIGNTTGDIGAAVQQHVEGEGFGVVRALVGHGVGYDVHEDPQVPNFGTPGQGEPLQEGLVIAVEPMVTIGSAAVVTASDGWAIETKGGGLAAHFEHTVAVTAGGPRVLTV
jgi:methionyl aminopeptidase